MNGQVWHVNTLLNKLPIIQKSASLKRYVNCMLCLIYKYIYTWVCHSVFNAVTKKVVWCTFLLTSLRLSVRSSAECCHYILYDFKAPSWMVNIFLSLSYQCCWCQWMLEVKKYHGRMDFSRLLFIPSFLKNSQVSTIHVQNSYRADTCIFLLIGVCKRWLSVMLTAGSEVV